MGQRLTPYVFKPDDARRFTAFVGIKAREKGNELQLSRCPYCGEKEGYFAISLATGAFNCKRASCGAKGNMLTLRKDFGFDLGRDVEDYEKPRMAWKRFKTPEKPIEPKPEALSYLAGRGIPEEVARRYEITVDRRDRTVLVFPFYGEDGALEYVKYRKTGFDPARDRNKEWCAPDMRAILFGMKQCEGGGRLVLTEGQIDSLSVAAAGIKNAVSVPNGKNGMTWIPHCWDWLHRFDSMVVFGDYERGAMTLLPEMQSRFPGRMLAVRAEDYRGCKDANEILQKHGADAVRFAVEHAEPVMLDQVVRLSDLQEEDGEEPERLPTGFPQLDAVLSGGLAFGYLDILTGKRGDGKSTFGSMILKRALECGCGALIYSGEMRPVDVRKWLDLQIAGPGRIQTQTTASGYERYSVFPYAQDRIRSAYHGLAYIYDGTRVTDEPANLLSIVETYLRQFGCRFALIDNLMTAIDVAPAGGTKFERQETMAKALARLAQQYGAIILLVAHKRKTDPKYESDENDDVLGSSEITNLAGTVLSYERSRTIDETQRLVKVTKNRLTGRLCFQGIVTDFDAASKRIYEAGGSPDGDSPLMGWQETFKEDETEEIPFD